MTKTLMIINPHAGGGRALTIWEKYEHTIRQKLGEMHPIITQYPEEVPNALKQASEEGVERVISIGGDGTNNGIVNALMAHNHANPDKPIAFGSIPAGTGRDWARGTGTPLDVEEAIEWITRTRLRPIDVGYAEVDGVPRHFLNISSVGISNDVVKRVEGSAKGGTLTFLKAILGSLLQYVPDGVQLYLDGKLWYEGSTYVTAVANGRYFASGLFVAPNAHVDDGLFDVVLAQGMRLPQVLVLLAQLYRGAHLTNPRVQVQRASEVRVVSTNGKPIGLDLDGEGAEAQEIRYRVLPKAIMAHV